MASMSGDAELPFATLVPTHDRGPSGLSHGGETRMLITARKIRAV
jgi:hypothetical protein